MSNIIPDLARTVHFVGDQHHGSISSSRRTVLESGLSTPYMQWLSANVAGTVHMGDLTNDATSGEDSLYNAHRLFYGPQEKLHAVMGNHDIRNDRDPDEHATTLGFPGSLWTKDLGFATLVGFIPGTLYVEHNSGSLFTPERLAWLDTTLTALDNAGKDVWLVNHFPLWNTVNGADTDPGVRKRSVTSGYYASVLGANHDNSDDVLAMLDTHPSVKTWVSAHIHADLTAPGLLTHVNTGSREIAHINVGAVAPLEVAQSSFSDTYTMFVTRVDGGIEVRARAHQGGGLWKSIQGERVTFLATT